jgi:hypothetical protein
VGRGRKAFLPGKKVFSSAAARPRFERVEGMNRRASNLGGCAVGLLPESRSPELPNCVRPCEKAGCRSAMLLVVNFQAKCNTRRANNGPEQSHKLQATEAFLPKGFLRGSGSVVDRRLGHTSSSTTAESGEQSKMRYGRAKSVNRGACCFGDDEKSLILV